jgi:hypothetical protein
MDFLGSAVDFNGPQIFLLADRATAPSWQGLSRHDPDDPNSDWRIGLSLFHAGAEPQERRAIRAEIRGTSFNLVGFQVGGWCYVFAVEDRFVLVEGAFEPALMVDTASRGGVSHALPHDPTFDAFVRAPVGADAREELRVEVAGDWLVLMSSLVTVDKLEKIGPWTGRRNAFELDDVPKVPAPAVEVQDGIGGNALVFRARAAAYRLWSEPEQTGPWGLAKRLVLVPER